MKPDLFRKRFFEGAPRYRWLEGLGRGATGIVYKALDLELDEIVAIKVLSPDLDQDESALLARFKREINLNRKIKHPNVARIFDFGLSGDYPYITMEYVSGKDLWTLIGDKTRYPPAEAIAILRQIARGCEAVHKLGIVHRDLKSSNVIVDEQGAVAILDFGLARGKANPNVTQAQVLLGTPHYMSPEQALGREVDARSDVYSIGVIAFEMLTGELPFMDDNPVTVALKHVNDPVPNTLERFPEIFPELRAVVMRCLEKNADERFTTAAELEAELALLQPAPVIGETEIPSEVLKRWAEPDAITRELESALDLIIASPKRPPPPSSSAFRKKLTPAASAPAEHEYVPALLVGDDNVPELLKWATTLCASGCTTKEVRSGPEAVEEVLKSHPDLVVMDVDLPGLDGFDTARVMAAQMGGDKMPILVVTSTAASSPSPSSPARRTSW
jgi:serine/threonine protein kinase